MLRLPRLSLRELNMNVKCPECGKMFDDLFYTYICPTHPSVGEGIPRFPNAEIKKPQPTEQEQLNDVLLQTKKLLTPWFDGFVIVCERSNENGDAAHHPISWSGGAARALGLTQVAAIKLKFELSKGVIESSQSEGENED